jgi:hypothetical protein
VDQRISDPVEEGGAADATIFNLLEVAASWAGDGPSPCVGDDGPIPSDDNLQES